MNSSKDSDQSRVLTTLGGRKMMDRINWFLMIVLFFALIVPASAAPGDNCTEPVAVSIPADLPYTSAFQTTCGRNDDYDNTCLGNYDGGEDYIYELNVASATDVLITLNPRTTAYTGILLDDECPPNPFGCISTSTSTTAGSHSLDCVSLSPGLYYIMVDTYPAPNCIASFDLTITTCTPFTATPTPFVSPGDWCTSPFSINVGDCILGNTSGLNNRHDCDTLPPHGGPDAVFQFTVPSAQNLTFLGEADYDADWSIATTCDDSNGDILCADYFASSSTFDPILSCSGITAVQYSPLNFTVTLTAGTYYIWVDGRNSSEFGNFALEIISNAATATPVATGTPTETPIYTHTPTLTPVPSATPPPVCPYAPETEPNNSCAEASANFNAMFCPEFRCGNLDLGDMHDYYEVYVLSDSVMFASVFGNDSGCEWPFGKGLNPYVEILALDCSTVLASNEDNMGDCDSPCRNPMGADAMAWAVLPAGTYYVHVTFHAGMGGPYVIQLCCDPPPSPTPTATNTSPPTETPVPTVPPTQCYQVILEENFDDGLGYFMNSSSGTNDWTTSNLFSGQECLDGYYALHSYCTDGSFQRMYTEIPIYFDCAWVSYCYIMTNYFGTPDIVNVYVKCADGDPDTGGFLVTTHSGTDNGNCTYLPGVDSGTYGFLVNNYIPLCTANCTSFYLIFEYSCNNACAAYIDSVKVLSDQTGSCGCSPCLPTPTPTPPPVPTTNSMGIALLIFGLSTILIARLKRE